MNFFKENLKKSRKILKINKRKRKPQIKKQNK